MTRLQKIALASKIMASFRKLFISKTAVTSNIAVAFTNLKNELITYINNAKTDSVNLNKSYADVVKADMTNVTTGLSNNITDLEQRISVNKTAIANLANLGTFCGSKNKWSDITAVTKDLYGANVTNGDSIELAVRDGSKPPGLYRRSGGAWETTPFVDYELANAVDEPVTQQDIDEATGVA